MSEGDTGTGRPPAREIAPILALFAPQWLYCRCGSGNARGGSLSGFLRLDPVTLALKRVCGQREPHALFVGVEALPVYRDTSQPELAHRSEQRGLLWQRLSSF